MYQMTIYYNYTACSDYTFTDSGVDVLINEKDVLVLTKGREWNKCDAIKINTATSNIR